MVNRTIKPEKNKDTDKRTKVRSCRWDKKYYYFISKCNVTTPYERASVKIKLEYPEKNEYGYRFFSPDSSINAIIVFLFNDIEKRTKDLEEVVIEPHGQKGNKYLDEAGNGWCKYVCEHEPLPQEQYLQIIREFKRLKDYLKKGKAQDIGGYLRYCVNSL